MMYKNNMLCVPRMRQIMVTNTSCLTDMNEDFKNAIRKCYSPYGIADKDIDKTSYIPEHRFAWHRSSPNYCGSISIFPKLH